MRCISCHRHSVTVICASCEEHLLLPTVSRRKVGTLEVISLFKYSAIEPFLLKKHSPEGHRMYRFFGRKFTAPFLIEFADNIDASFALLGIDDHVRHGYAHTALLIQAVRHARIQKMYGKLLAQNRVSYAGKTLQYRLDHPRNFSYTGTKELDVVFVDDIVTTGVTLQEAQYALHQVNVNVLFALTLADAQY